MKILLYKGGIHHHYAICVVKDSPTYNDAVAIGFRPVTAYEVRKLDCPVRWNA